MIADEVELLALLPSSVQERVARGEILLSVVLELVTTDYGDGLCPRCLEHPVRADTYPGRRFGICSPCAKRALADASRELESNILAVRGADQAKKAVQRAREAVGDDLPEHLRANKKLGRRQTTDPQ